MQRISVPTLFGLRGVRPLLFSICAIVALVVAGVGGSGPVSGAPTATTITVRDDANAVVVGAQVFRNCFLVGSTNASGQITLATAVAGDHIFVRKLVQTATTSKAHHDGWAYHVWITNLTQNNDGTQTDYTILNPAVGQTINVRKANTQIGFNIVASFNYNATTDNINDYGLGLAAASTYLWDVSDGQMFFEHMDVYENNQYWNDADIQLYPSVWPNADPNGPTGLASTTSHLRMPGPGFDGNSYSGSWTYSNGFRTIIHEFGHYGIGAYDEYVKWDGTANDWVAASCTLDRDSVAESSRASIMSYQYNSTELCGDSNHNADTQHGQLRGDSVWAWLVSQYGNAAWTLRTPMSRGAVDPGPTDLPCPLQAVATTHNSADPVCSAPPLVHATYGGSDFKGATVTLHDGTANINEGTTDASGNAFIYGSNNGDTFSVSSVINSSSDGFGWFMASGTITTCGATYEAPLNYYFIPIFYLIPEWHYSRPDPELEISFRVLGDPPPFNILVNQDGINEQQVALTFNQRQGTYVGHYLADLGVAANFHIGLQAFDPNQLALNQSFNVYGAQFKSVGPASLKTGAAATSGWDLFPSDLGVNVGVDSTSLPDGTGVSVSDTSLPTSAPSGLTLVGGPYTVVAEAVLSHTSALTLRYQSARFGGLMPGFTSIYRYDTGTQAWVALRTELVPNEGTALASIDQWGIYAVFAAANEPANTPEPTQTRQPTSTATATFAAQTATPTRTPVTGTVTVTPTPCPLQFSDVHADDFFYQPVQYMYCRGIISGYSDNTFRPFANTTRGQLAKIVVLAENFAITEPTQPTFSDVTTANPFYKFIETAVARNIISGYQVGNRREFRPNNNVTRGQLSKIVVNAEGWALVNPTTPTFADVTGSNPFYKEIETAVQHNIISGYDISGGRREFRWGNNATRGQIAKIIVAAVTQP